jgi:hypothetical protein
MGMLVGRLLAAVTGATQCDGFCARAYREPQRVATEAAPEGAAFCGGECGVPFACDRGEFGSVISRIQFGGGELGLAGTAVLNVIVERFEVGGGDLRRGNWGVGKTPALREQ